jgi:hypothetical protein
MLYWSSAFALHMPLPPPPTPPLSVVAVPAAAEELKEQLLAPEEELT